MEDPRPPTYPTRKHGLEFDETMGLLRPIADIALRPLLASSYVGKKGIVRIYWQSMVVGQLPNIADDILEN